MAYYLTSGNGANDGPASPTTVQEPPDRHALADIRVFWGPDICRLEYLLHLVDTGRIKGESNGES
jgi:hypothetical protein